MKFFIKKDKRFKEEEIKLVYQEIIKDFIQLVKIDVQSRKEREIADVLKTKLKALGCQVEEDGAGDLVGGDTGNIIAKLKGTKDVPTILFSSHMDRVKNGIHIHPVIVGEKIKSDGNTILAADDVSGIAAILDGIRQIKEEGIEHGDIEIVFSVCEEQGVLGSKYLDFSKLESKIAYVFDSPGRMGRIINQAPAKNKVTVRIYGKAAHAGNEPEKGINALKVMATSLSDLKEGRISEFVTSNFSIIKGGESTNVVCDYAELTGEVRGTKQEEIDAYIIYLKETFEKTTKDFNATLEIDIEKHYDTFYVSEEEKVSKILIQAMKALDVDYHFSKGGGGMDANRFNKAGIQSLGIATGYEKNHTLEESIYINDLIKAGQLVKEIIIQAPK